jgi:hypothetical protein
MPKYDFWLGLKWPHQNIFFCRYRTFVQCYLLRRHLHGFLLKYDIPAALCCKIDFSELQKGRDAYKAIAASNELIRRFLRIKKIFKDKGLKITKNWSSHHVTVMSQKVIYKKLTKTWWDRWRDRCLDTRRDRQREGHLDLNFSVKHTKCNFDICSNLHLSWTFPCGFLILFQHGPKVNEETKLKFFVDISFVSLNLNENFNPEDPPKY